MSIEIAGPQGYDYQYLVTTLITTQLLAEYNETTGTASLSVLVEGGEDAAIRISSESMTQTIELQVKGSEKNIDLDKLVSWLFHFSKRSASDCVINRLRNSDYSVLFVTRARCCDDVSHLRSEYVLKTHSMQLMPDDCLNRLFEHISKYIPDGKSNIAKARLLTCKNISSYLHGDLRILKQMMQKVIIWEESSDVHIESSIDKLLMRFFCVPLSKTIDVRDKLVKAVRSGRDRGNDIVPDFKKILADNHGYFLRIPDPYLPPPNYVQLQGILDRNHFLYLTGVSGCGKTSAARSLALELQQNGYNCLETNDIYEARRFLQLCTQEDRICIIDDPFGTLYLKDDSAELNDILFQIEHDLGKDRKLIVTSRIELIKALRINVETDPLQSIASSWIDLTVNNTSGSFVMSPFPICVSVVR